MFGGYSGYWPQWWNMWNNYRYWPGYWNNWSWMWNNNYPFYYSKKDKQQADKEHIISKRSSDSLNEDQVSRMVGGYGGYLPQEWNMWNHYRYWPSQLKKWNWMWNRHGNFHTYYPFRFSRRQDNRGPNMRIKRSTSDDTDGEDISRVMGGHGGYWPQRWNMWSNYRYWPGYWNNWNWMWNNYNPFHFSKEKIEKQSDMKHVREKRSTENGDEDQVSRMMGGYGGHWPQWWNMWNKNRYWPGYWNDWYWMWNNYNPFYFSKENTKENLDKEHILTKRSTDTSEEDQVSRMMGGYSGYWPQWWNMWNNYRYWPGYWKGWYSTWNNYYPFYFSKENEEAQSDKERVGREKRGTETKDKDTISRMMGGYGGNWPQWWNMWNNYRYWPNWNNWVWSHFSKGFPVNSYHRFQNTQYGNGHHTIFKRNADENDKMEEKVAHMMNGYQYPHGPDLQNIRGNDNYQPHYWNSQADWSHNWNRNTWMWNRNPAQFSPNMFFYHQSGGPDFPPSAGYRWNTGNGVNRFPSDHPFAFSQDGNGASDDPSKKQREKRSSGPVQSKNSTVENTTDTTSASDTDSASDPDIARQMSSFDGSSANPYQQQWWRLYRSYVNSKPRHWGGKPRFTAYENPFDNVYRMRYSDRFGRYYYVRYFLPWRLYQYWFQQMCNRWAQNQMWYDTMRRGSTSRYSPFSKPASDPDVRQQRTDGAAPEGEETGAQRETDKAEEKRTKRSLGGMNSVSRYLYPYGSMLGLSYNSPSWWNNVVNSNGWPLGNYFMHNRVWGPRNRGNDWVWPSYNGHPFMYLQKRGSSTENTKQRVDENTPSMEQNKADAATDSGRSKRSTGQTSGEDEDEHVSRWMRVPDQFYNQPMWKQNSWGQQMPGWMGGNPKNGFNDFYPGFMNNKFMPSDRFNQYVNQDRKWDSFNNFHPFSFSESDLETEKQPSGERQKRSSEEDIETRSSADDVDPKVSRWVRGYLSMPPMISRVYPWPMGMRQGWQYQGHNSQSHWRTWNGWGEGKSWNNWNTAYTATFPSPSFAFSAGEATNAEKIRQKRSSEHSPGVQSEDSEDASEDDPEVSRMGRGFGWRGVYPMGGKKHSPSMFEDRRWMGYTMPDSYVYGPRRSNWQGKNHFPSGWLSSQNRFFPQWNRYQNVPFWGWRDNRQMQNVNNWNNFQNFRKMNPFNNGNVDESVFDPLSSYYFSKKDALTSSNEEKIEKSMADKTTSTDTMTATSQEEAEDRSKRSVITLASLLTKGNRQPGQRQLNFQTMLKPNRRFLKRSAPYKVKRFSPEATARLEKRFQKRSPTTTTPPPATTSKDPPTSPEVAPRMAMRATAPARGQQDRDREWGPPRDARFPPDPNTNPSPSDRSEIPNPGFSPGRGSGQAAGSGQGVDPQGSLAGPGDWGWDRSGWSANLNWAGGQDDDQGSRDKGQEQKDRDSTSTTTTTSSDSQPGGNPSDSFQNGDSQNRLSNYNYIDVNNPDYWNQFFNPSSVNSSAGRPLGNASQWDNWFGLWAYGPNFWDDMNDLDLWDAPWGSGSWGMGPGGSQWGGNWWGNPATDFSSSSSSSAQPVEMGWEIFWLDDCDGDWSSRDSGFRPLNTRDWWNLAQFLDVDVMDVLPGHPHDRDCGDCLPPYVLSPPRRYHASFRFQPLSFRPSFSVLRPARYWYRPPRFFRPVVTTRGSSAGPWYRQFPGYPWDSYGKAQWRGFPWWGWNPNSFWNPWRYRIQYHNHGDPKVSRSRRSSGHDPLASPTSTTAHKLVPSKPGSLSPGNTPSRPSPFNEQGLVGPGQYPGRLGPPFNPALVGPYSSNNNGAGWGFGGQSSGKGWGGIPWWDKNNWHVAPTRDDLASFPPSRNQGVDPPPNNFPGLAGPSNFPTRVAGPSNFPTRVAGPSNFPTGMEGPSNLPAGMEGPSNFPTGMEGPSNLPAGMGGPSNLPAGMGGPSNFPTGMEGPSNLPAGMGGPSNFPTGMAGPSNFPAGMAGPSNLPAGMEGPSNFPAGMAGPSNFPTKLAGPSNFPAGMAGPSNFPTGMEGPSNFPAGMEGPSNFPAAGSGHGRPWSFPRHSPLGPHPGPLRQEGGDPAGDVEAVRGRGAEPVTPPPSPWNPSPWNRKQSGGRSSSKDIGSAPDDGHTY
ncbi:uncharacterized protein LOC143274868 isoform X2 [Babylonia areolata]|uniref:uncharacterized protein LOC143274868 isoform X2 n=1 Tax=Babylonia areolata TaxID=304850 RepID=UPI003FD0797F